MKTTKVKNIIKERQTLGREKKTKRNGLGAISKEAGKLVKCRSFMEIYNDKMGVGIGV